MPKQAKGTAPGIKSQLRSLEPVQRELVQAIFNKLFDGKALAKKDAGLLGIEFDHVPHQACADIFQLTRRGLYKWADEGCPRNEDGTYSVYDVHRWQMRKQESKHKQAIGVSDLERKKHEQEIELRHLRISEKRKQLIELDLHKQILGSRMAGLKNFWQTVFARNRHQRASKTVDELAIIDDALVRDAMDAYLQGSKSIDKI